MAPIQIAARNETFVVAALLATFSVPNARLPENYENPKRELALCASIDECHSSADKCAALASYARQDNDQELMRYAVRVRDRAIRRAGRLYKKILAAHRAMRWPRERATTAASERMLLGSIVDLAVADLWCWFEWRAAAL